MKRGALLLAATGLTAAAAITGVLVGCGPSSGTASSHREAPLIADDPAADNTDVYAFVSPDKASTVTLVANYIPFEDPAGGPNFFKFDPDGRLRAARRQRRRREGGRELRVPVQDHGHEPEHVPLQHGSDRLGRERRRPEREADLQRHAGHRAGALATSEVIGRDLVVPPANIGPRSNPTYDPYAGVQSLGADRKVFAGPRDDPFFVDLGSIFDLGGLRPFNSFHVIPLADEAGKDGLRNYNVHTIALQVPKTDLVKAPNANGIIGVYASASRPKIRILRGDGTIDANGPQVQVSRLGNPLVNEVIIPLGQKDRWNASDPADDKQFERYYVKPELAGLVNFLYPALPDTDTDEPAGSRRRAADGREAARRLALHVHGRHAGRPAAAEHGRPADRDAESARGARG